MKKIRLRIEGMTCSACSNGLEKYLNKQDGVIDAVVNLVLQEATIKYKDNITVNQLENFVSEAGFKSLGVATDEDIIKVSKKNKIDLIVMGILTSIIFISSGPAGLFLGLIILDTKYVLIMLVLTIGVLYLGRDIIIKGVKNFIHKTPNMDSLVTLSVVISFVYSIYTTILILLGTKYLYDQLYFGSVVMVLFFVKLGRHIEEKSRYKTMDSVKELVQITPEMAILKINDKEKKVTIDEVKKDDVLIAKPGMKIAVDGVILNGSSHLDEAFITGESIPVKKVVGDKVIAGSMNYDGVLEYKAEKIGRESTISEIVHLVVDATNTKAPIMRKVDKVSSYFVPVLLIVAIITFVSHLLLHDSLNEALNVFVTILVVACPCALGLATPLALMVSNGVCAKKGILVKTGEILENASKVDTIIFDKTGTLTKGNLAISKIYIKNTYEEKELLKVVASIEKNSTHPISYTFTNYAIDNELELLEVKEFKNISGIGVTGKINKELYYLGNNKLFEELNIDSNPYKKQELELAKSGNSIVYVIKNNEVIALIGIKDLIRVEAKEVLLNLKNLNKEVVMLTGDNEEVANLVGKELGIDKVIANVRPKDKSKVIKEYKEKGKMVMMVGDGINDAPALALADIGISLEGASDIATNTADVIILKNDLTRIVSLVIISKKTLDNVYQNLFWACFYNICMIPIAMGLFKGFGLSLEPVMASMAMILSSLTVEFNALRLKRIIKI